MNPDEPDPPVNVRLERPDGKVVPLELTYEGERDGLHVWMVANVASPLLLDVVARGKVCCDRLPAKTVIVLPIA